MNVCSEAIIHDFFTNGLVQMLHDGDAVREVDVAGKVDPEIIEVVLEYDRIKPEIVVSHLQEMADL